MTRKYPHRTRGNAFNAGLRAGLMTLAVSLLAAPVFAQPSSGGALQSIGGIAKSLDRSLLPKAIKAPESLVATGPSEMRLLCDLDARELTETCSVNSACAAGLNVECKAVEVAAAGVDFVASGIGLRNAGGGTIALRGAPPESRLVAAWLYWGAIVPPEHIGEVGRILFAGYPVSGEPIGTSPQPCWKETTTFAVFRADVRELMSGKVNGDYPLEILPGSIKPVTDGRNPWSPIDKTEPLRYNGASLIAVYAHESIPPTSRFLLHEGPHMMIGEGLFRHPLDVPLGPLAEARHLRFGGDGQTHGERRQPVAPFITSMASAGNDWQVLRGQQSEIDRHTDWQGLDGGTSNQLWDTQITEAPARLMGLVSGASDYWVEYRSDAGLGDGFLYDCVGVVGHALSVR